MQRCVWGVVFNELSRGSRRSARRLEAIGAHLLDRSSVSSEATEWFPNTIQVV